MIKQLKRYFLCFFLTILFFSVGMMTVYFIPNDWLEPQYPKSLAQLDKEDIYPAYLFGADGAIMDNFMDSQMVKTCQISSAYDSMITAAFDNNGYPRYWNGYLLTLRPVLTQFTYQQIRYLNMFILLTCFCFCFSGIQHRVNAAAAFGFAVSVIACFLVFIGESLQYFSVFMITFSVILLILYIQRFGKPENSALLLFLAGMFTNFFDMLTAPLLSLGMPLIVILLLLHENFPEISLRKQFLVIFGHSVSWGAGYALCWIAKWAIGSLIIGTNIFEDAMKTAKFRVAGSEEIPLDRGMMFRLNIDTYFFSKGHKPALFLLAALIVLLVILFRQHKKNLIRTGLPILSVTVFPYLWFFVFANHSQLHYFYTYRIQAVTLFAVFAAPGNMIKRGRNDAV